MSDELRVVTITGQEFYLEKDTMTKVKNEIEKVTGIPYNEQSLITKNKDTIMVMAGLYGGQVTGEIIPSKNDKLLIIFKYSSRKKLKLVINQSGKVTSNIPLKITNIDNKKNQLVQYIKIRILSDNLIRVTFISEDYKVNLFQQQYLKFPKQSNKKAQKILDKYPCNYYCLDKNCTQIVNGCSRMRKTGFLLQNSNTNEPICNLGKNK